MTIEADRPSSSTLEIAIPDRTHPWSVEIQDEGGGRRVLLPPSTPIVVGSSSKCDVVVADGTVSGRHCRLSVLGSGVTVEDLGSKNGTYVGNARVREAWASANAVIALGRSTMVVVPTQDADDEEPGEPLSCLAGGSLVMRRLATRVRRLAGHCFPVLIGGETGTGKELVARALHDEGLRAGRPFVAINVSALPRELVETELFGHERGAFTGAVSQRRGAFDEADGGTLFLDEIGELPLEAQPKLLRALDGYEVRRVGGSGGGRRSNVRVVAATHVPLEQRITDGQFRRDLFHRLEVFVIQVPPLRDRRGDIAPIARALLARHEPELGKRTLTPHALARLAAYEWPGNVRELRNVLYRASDLAATSATLDDVHIESAMRPRSDAPPAPSAITPALAKAVLREQGGNMSAAARACRLPRTTFRKLLAR